MNVFDLSEKYLLSIFFTISKIFGVFYPQVYNFSIHKIIIFLFITFSVFFYFKDSHSFYSQYSHFLFSRDSHFFYSQDSNFLFIRFFKKNIYKLLSFSYLQDSQFFGVFLIHKVLSFYYFKDSNLIFTIFSFFNHKRFTFFISQDSHFFLKSSNFIFTRFSSFFF